MIEGIRKSPNFTRANYEHAKKNNALERFRGDEISFRISQKYPLNAQIAILMDKDFKYQEWCDYQSFRSEIKTQVDIEIAEFKY